MSLKPNPSGWSIVIIGLWNRQLFTPAWLSNRITPSEEFGIEVPMHNLLGPVRLRFEGLIFQAQPNRLQLSVEQCELGLMSRATEVAIKILKELTQTPISATGINFGFLIEDPTSKLIGAFKLPDTGALSDADCIVEQTEVNRKLRAGGIELNFKLTLRKSGATEADFNFTAETANSEAAIAFLTSNSPVELHAKAMDILKRIYDINLEEQEQSHVANHN